ncbi:E3 ubiquitin-protein ligase AMFR-like [Toxorhynchites rutilus septentrionalis]|uniref:E3 ubiquitin-protein ligase AMFR-like n=1 Tax=Toxorhynchites rutilus septentrionalis TaxID=329112 RepID=UPI00247AA5F2|nr:E3 ubiquitin-protein ligase AMFR-like [Toxorhynchites rutilus septentrionalis]
MPVVLNGSIPLPSIRVYTSASVLLVSICLYYAVMVTNDPSWRQQSNGTSTPTNVNAILSGGAAGVGEAATAAGVVAGAAGGGVAANGGRIGDTLDSLLAVKEIDDLEEKILAATDADLKRMLEQQTAELLGNIAANDSRSIGAHLKDVASFMGSEPFCIWTLINMAYCCLVLLGKSIQKVVFGELRISEQQHIKDKFWNFIFYKFIFVFGVVNVQYLHEVILWVSWFSVLGFLHLMAQLSKDRFEYLSFSPTTPGWSHFRLIALLSAILTLSGFMLIVSIGVGVFNGVNTFAFMAAECVLLSIRTLHVLIRYAMFLYDMRQGGITHESISWDKRGPVAYYIELVFEVAALFMDFGHHLHMLLWSNIFLSMASLVIIMHLRYLINEIQRKIKKHRNYLWVLNHMEKSYPLATAEDLKQNSDNCAICWEKMETARKLPCAHLFHNSCLQSWLEQDTSCPTCRLGLSVHNNNASILENEIRIDDTEPAGRTANNHFFHFNGSRYVSWLPNFSVEVTHINTVLRNDPIPRETAAANHTSQIRNMARHVQEMFPRFPLPTLIADLQNSRSIEVTIDNILEGRLQVPARFQEFDDLLDDDPTIATTPNVSLNESNNSSGHLSNSNSFISTGSSPPDSPSSPSGVDFPAVTANDYYVNANEFHPNGHYGSVSTPPSPAGSSGSGYEVERNTNIFGNFDNLLRDDSFDDVIPLGERFSKSSEERERILQRRKEQLLLIARRKYVEKNKSELNQMPQAGYSQGDAIRHRNKSCMEEVPQQKQQQSPFKYSSISSSISSSSTSSSASEIRSSPSNTSSFSSASHSSSAVASGIVAIVNVTTTSEQQQQQQQQQRPN